VIGPVAPPPRLAMLAKQPARYLDSVASNIAASSGCRRFREFEIHLGGDQAQGYPAAWSAASTFASLKVSSVWQAVLASIQWQIPRPSRAAGTLDP
jgi:hypothetical protein